MTLLYGNMDLTSKEWAITALVFQGRTNAEIAAEIQSTKQAVDGSLVRIFEKTGCWNRTEVALWYMRMGPEKERRFHDRREETREIGDERRHVDRRHIPRRSPRANEQHQINLDE
jgi:DNA-binding CsgD family transcriptional regulator